MAGAWRYVGGTRTHRGRAAAAALALRAARAAAPGAVRVPGVPRRAPLSPTLSPTVSPTVSPTPVVPVVLPPEPAADAAGPGDCLFHCLACLFAPTNTRTSDSYPYLCKKYIIRFWGGGFFFSIINTHKLLRMIGNRKKKTSRFDGRLLQSRWTCEALRGGAEVRESGDLGVQHACKMCCGESPLARNGQERRLNVCC